MLKYQACIDVSDIAVRLCMVMINFLRIYRRGIFSLSFFSFWNFGNCVSYSQIYIVEILDLKIFTLTFQIKISRLLKRCVIQAVRQKQFFQRKAINIYLFLLFVTFLSPSRIQKIVLECVTLPSDWISSSWQSNIRLEANIVFLP